jgi:hypothetical protein
LAVVVTGASYFIPNSRSSPKLFWTGRSNVSEPLWILVGQPNGENFLIPYPIAQEILTVGSCDVISVI